MNKKRSRSSYIGNTKEARKRQLANLISGADSYQRKRVQEARLGCFWEAIPLKSKQEIFEVRVNDRCISTYVKKETRFPEILKVGKKYDLEYIDVPVEELKDEKYLADWWDRQELGEKQFIYKNEITYLSKETISWILKYMEKCLKKKLKKGL